MKPEAALPEMRFSRIRAARSLPDGVPGLALRRAILGRLADGIRRAEPQIVAALAQDLGRNASETALVEILPLLQEIAHARRNLGRWMRPRRLRTGLSGLGTRALLMTEPKGTCLILAPWNYPFVLALGPLVSCLAAGNGAIIKPSELAPASAALIAGLVADAVDPDLATVIEGDKTMAERLLALPFDHIFFTGSPEVGRVVMAAAARHLASVTLELGGKSPCIVGPGADLDQAARWIVFGKFVNAGQTCIAPDHVLVHDSQQDGLRAALRRAVERAYPGGLAARDLGAIVSDSHTARLTGMLGEALAEGARLVCGGAARNRRIAPTIVEAMPEGCTLDRAEIFGPILPLIPYSDLDQALARINDRPKPLAIYVFDRDKAMIDRVLRETSSGAVGVNLTMLQFSNPRLPFGGIGTSGLGAAHGEWGFRAFSHEKPVLRNHLSPVPLLFPPYGARGARLIGWARRLLG
ncbi:MAG: aldehyde dehydrogenase family protein [Gemmobacter sp.]|nr:aldehyde dehydrogenase family protein [Gemmobacter sp.]